MSPLLRPIPLALLFLAFLCAAWTPAGETTTDLDRRLVGNVYGTVVDALTSQPVGGAEILLFDQSFRKMPKAEQKGATAQTLGEKTVESDSGPMVLRDFSSAVRRAVTNERGEFLINFVPTPFPFEIYTIIIRAPGHNLFVLDQVRVLPGAVTALRVDCKLSPGDENVATVIAGNDPSAPVRYRHERSVQRISKPEKRPIEKASLTYTVFATREGLVGGTTANGHIIAPRDHFVALPSRRALNPDDQTYDFRVELSYSGRTVRAPVWDIGPWNTEDDYWNPSAIREMWQDLPQGTPEAQAAYLDGYNGGHDEFGRTVLNPAGIDLADGTFWDDLAMSDNDWASVTFLWRPGLAVGERVETSVTLNVRSAPAGGLVGTVPAGSTGIITDGPRGASFNNYFWIWWEIQWDGGLHGWSVENWLTRIEIPTAARPSWRRYE